MSSIRLNVLFGDERVGQVVESTKGVFFQYDLRFRHELSPLNLPLSRELYGPFDWAGNTIPGLLVDSLPDSFGMHVIRERFLREGRPKPGQVGLLAYQGSRTMGALTYEPSDGFADAQEFLDISAAVDSARAVQSHVHSENLDSAFLISGATAGGAYPKVLIAMDDSGKEIITGTDQISKGKTAWLLKLNCRGNDDAPMEQAYVLMAKEAGLELPETRLLRDDTGTPHFAVKRFDRDPTNPNQRRHIHSYASMRHLDFRSTTCDYSDLFETAQEITREHPQIEELYARMVFNCLAHVHDDHAKNFSFIYNAETQAWRLSPAYDLTFSVNDLGGPWMMINGKRNELSRRDLETLGASFSIRARRMHEIFDRCYQATEHWARHAENAGMSESAAFQLGIHLNASRRAFE